MKNLVITDHDTCEEVLLNGGAWDDYEDLEIEGPFDAIISIVGTTPGNSTPPGGWEYWNALRIPKLRLEFDDVLEEGSRDLHAPTRQDVLSIINFGGTLKGRTLIHCAAGVSRSTAAGLILLALRRSPQEAVEELYRIRKRARPNPRMVALGDTLLGLQGALVKALEDA
jgi:hypothetical protein